jgi:hypothetical protein
MTIDKQKLQKLLWSEVASWKADCSEWKQSSEALGEFLGEKTVEEVALELLTENERLAAACERAEQVINAESKSAAIATGRANLLQAERDQLKAENVALLSTLKGMTSMYGHCWDLVDGGLLCMQDNVQRFEDAHEAAQKVIAAMGKGE